MKKFLLLLIVIGSPLFAQKDHPNLFFSEAISMHLSDYNEKANQAYRFREFDKGKTLFENFTSDYLIGTYMDDFKFRNLKKKELSLHQFDKPVFLITYASWCIPAKGEIPALNELAKEYQQKLKIIVLFWDDFKTVKKLSSDFDSNIMVAYFDESENSGANTVKNLKHALGFPTCYMMDENMKITNIQRTVSQPFIAEEQVAFRENYELLRKSINENLVPAYKNEAYAGSSDDDEE